VKSERKFVDEKVMKLIELKRSLCTPENNKSFVVINQKGIDPLSLDLLAKDGIIGIRRAKRRNMERITLACGGVPCNSVDDIVEESLGWADLVYEEVLGDDKFTFVEGVRNPLSATILVKGPDAHTVAQLMDAVRDGTRAVANAMEDESVIAGAGAFELACSRSVRRFKSTVTGKAKLGVEAFAEAMLVIPKTLCENSGFDVMDTIIALQEEMESAGPDAQIGLDCLTGEPMLPAQEGIWDIARVKTQSIQLSTVIASQLLLVDELMRAGRGRTKG
jgi:T-complex protein 1 subunit zeta